MSRLESEISGPSEFPSTVWSRLVAGEDRRASIEYLARHYWRPAYLYIRRRWRKGPEDARDLTQGFFATAIESELLSKADPGRGSFRKFLRASIENFLRNDYRDSRALKRGGAESILSLEATGAADAAVARNGDPAELFDREWIESVFERCMPLLAERYAKEGRPEYFEIFRRYDVDRPVEGGPTYDDLAREFHLSIDDVRNRLTHARDRWRKSVLDELREASGTAADFAAEVKDLFPA